MDIRLKELLHNLKDRNWDVNPTYKIDENEAKKIIEGIEAVEETDKKIADYTYMIELLQDRIKEIEKSDKWIPCSERLPEDSGEYLVWIKPYSGKSYVSIEDIDCDGMFKKWNTIYANSNKIVAWMPLPQPYKAESEE